MADLDNPLACALHALRGSPNTDAAGHDDAEDADALQAHLRALGWHLVPVALDEAMRRAVWQAQAEHLIQTPAARETYVAAHLADPRQRELDQAAWAAMHAEAARRLADG